MLKIQGFWQVKVHQQCSWGWRKILKIRELVRLRIKFQVGDSSSIYLWHDNWHLDGPLLLEHGHSVVYDAASSTICYAVNCH